MDFNITHDMLVGLAKGFGLFYMFAMFIAVCVYAFWPSNAKKFDRAAKSILDDEEGPCP